MNAPALSCHDQQTGLERNYRSMFPWIPENTPIEDYPHIITSDVSCRDGKQALPWYQIPKKEILGRHVELAAQMGIPHIEIGFAAVPDDPETDAVKYIAERTGDSDVLLFSLARTVKGDIDTALKALAPAKYKGIHTFIGTSPEHMQVRQLTPEKIMEMTRRAVKQIVDAGYVCQFSPEDATRTDSSVLRDVLGVAVDEGATILNIPDTLGTASVMEYLEILKKVRAWYRDAIISIHVHNDSSSAEAIALAGVESGLADRIEGTLFGIGERAGNTDIGSILMTIISRANQDARRNINSPYVAMAQNLLKNPAALSEMCGNFTEATGIHKRPTAPGYGFDALVARSGIHQAAVRGLKDTYLWMEPDKFGFEPRKKFDISPLSGKGGVEELMKEMGLNVPQEQMVNFTAYLRAIFSPDTTIEDFLNTTRFSHIPREKLESLASKISEVKNEARTIRDTDTNLARWNEMTRLIIREAHKGYFANI